MANVTNHLDRAKDDAKSAAGEVKNAAQTAAHNAGQHAQTVVGQAKDAVQNAAGTAYDKARDFVGNAGKKAEDAVGGVGESMTSLAGTIREKLPRDGVIGQAAGSVADAVETGGRYLQNEGLAGMGEDLAGVIRRNPLPAVLAGIGVGFLLARATSRS